MDRDPDSYLKNWPRLFILFSAPMGLFFTLIYAELIGSIIRNLGITLSVIVTNIIVLVIILVVFFGTIFRDSLIRRVFNHYPEKLYNVSHNSLQYYWLVLLIVFGIMIYGKYYNLTLNEILHSFKDPVIL